MNVSVNVHCEIRSISNVLLMRFMIHLIIMKAFLVINISHCSQSLLKWYSPEFALSKPILYFFPPISSYRYHHGRSCKYEIALEYYKQHFAKYYDYANRDVSPPNRAFCLLPGLVDHIINKYFRFARILFRPQNIRVLYFEINVIIC